MCRSQQARYRARWLHPVDGSSRGVDRGFEGVDVHGRRLAFYIVRPPVDEAGGWLGESVERVLGEEDGVAGRLGELFDAGGDVDGVADEGELELPGPADGAGDDLTGVD